MNSGIQSWKNLVIFAFNVFSIRLLVKTLFAPWKMDTADGSGYSWFEKFVFGIISRVLGFAARIVLIALGLAFTAVMICLFPIFLILPVKIGRERLQGLGSFGASLSYGNTYTLNKHSRELATDPGEKFFGKERVFRMIERAFSKENNHNVLLVGDTGVGKSTIIKYLARLGESGLSFPSIQNHRVVELSAENITADDFDKSLEEASKAGNVIVAIENIHSYTGIYDKLAPYLNSRHLGIIVTTDFSNYDRVLKNYPEFLSKFEKIDIEPTTAEETLAILKNETSVEGVAVGDEALMEIIRLTDRLIGNQPQPMKSLLILDELRSLHRAITIDDVRQVISDKTNVPVGAMGADEKKVLLDLEENMRKKIVGQDEAVKDVSEALRRLRTGVNDPSKPAGSFLFLGPTGVGKTYTAKILAESYFGRKNAMIRFDMSEFSQPDSVGAFADRLTAVIEEAPLSLVFFDELEKASRVIHNLLLQVLDEGRLTRESGREANFKEAIIITTSNAGSADIIANPNVDKKTLVDGLIKNNIFAPEFLNRFNSIILFRPLDAAQARSIAKLLLEEFAERLQADKNIKLEISDALIDKVSAAGFDPEFGARPIKRAIEELVENKVAEFILKGEPGGELKIL
ncbi:MAG: AAA family ATPase [bacterium]